MIEKILYPTAYGQDLLACPDGTMADPGVGCVEIPKGLVNPGSGLLQLILAGANYLMIAAAGLAVLFLLYGAIRYATAAGDQGQIDQAKRMLFWSIFGLILSLVAMSVVQFVLNIVQ